MNVGGFPFTRERTALSVEQTIAPVSSVAHGDRTTRRAERAAPDLVRRRDGAVGAAHVGGDVRVAGELEDGALRGDLRAVAGVGGVERVPVAHGEVAGRQVDPATPTAPSTSTQTAPGAGRLRNRTTAGGTSTSSARRRRQRGYLSGM